MATHHNPNLPQCLESEHHNINHNTIFGKKQPQIVVLHNCATILRSSLLWITFSKKKCEEYEELTLERKLAKKQNTLKEKKNKTHHNFWNIFYKNKYFPSKRLE